MRTLANPCMGGGIEPMDDEQVLELRRWAQRLAGDDRADIRAAGKAIVMLADELRALRAQRLESDAVDESSRTATTTAAPDPRSEELASSLRTRLRSFVGVRDHADG